MPEPAVEVSVPAGQVAELDVSMSPAKALAALSGTSFGAVRLEDGAILSVVARPELERLRSGAVARLADPDAGLPAGVALRRGVSLAVLAGDDAVTLLDLVGQAEAVAVVDNEEVFLGLFVLEAFDRYLAEGGRVVDTDVLGAAGFSRDGQAVGRIGIGLARVVCARCGHANTLVPPVDLENLGLCANPGLAHPLVLALAGGRG